MIKTITQGCFKYKDYLVYFYFDGAKLSRGHDLPVIMFLNGLPRPGKIEHVIDDFTERGYVFCNIYYGGYWEADGIMQFSKIPKEVIALARYIRKGNIDDIFSNKKIKFEVKELFLIGSSFGGTISLNCRDKIFDKVIAISPLVDFKAHDELIKDLFMKLSFFKSVIRLKSSLEKAKLDFNLLDPIDKFYVLSYNDVLIIADINDGQIKFSKIKKYANKQNFKLLKTAQSRHGYKLLLTDKIRQSVVNFLTI